MTEREQRMVGHAAQVLLKTAAEQMAPQPVIDAAYEILGVPIILIDTVFQPIAVRVPDGIDFASLSRVEGGDLHQMKDWMKVVKESREPVIDESGSPFRVMCYDVHVHGAEVAKLSLYETRPFRDSDPEILKLLASALACVMEESWDHQPNPGLSGLIRDLIRGSISVQETQRTQQVFDIQTRDGWQVLTMRDPEGESVTYPMLIARCFHRLDGTAIVWGDQLVCLLPIGRSKTEVEQFLREGDLQGGLSRSFRELSNLRDYYLQSSFALEQAEKANELLADYGELLARDVAAHCCRDRGADSFCRPEVLKLKAYDIEHDTDYMRTLECYCRNMCSITETARESFLHYNTIKYRLKTIRELTGMGELTGEDLFEYWLSFRLLEQTDK